MSYVVISFKTFMYKIIIKCYVNCLFFSLKLHIINIAQIAGIKKQKQWLDLFLFISYPNRSSYLLKKKKQCTEMEQK